jgi:hypothetical protein
MRLLYDALATFDVVGAYLLIVIRFQTIYVAIFRGVHGWPRRSNGTGWLPTKR